jgi:hypothetical protein
MQLWLSYIFSNQGWCLTLLYLLLLLLKIIWFWVLLFSHMVWRTSRRKEVEAKLQSKKVKSSISNDQDTVLRQKLLDMHFKRGVLFWSNTLEYNNNNNNNNNNVTSLFTKSLSISEDGKQFLPHKRMEGEMNISYLLARGICQCKQKIWHPQHQLSVRWENLLQSHSKQDFFLLLYSIETSPSPTRQNLLIIHLILTWNPRSSWILKTPWHFHSYLDLEYPSPWRNTQYYQFSSTCSKVTLSNIVHYFETNLIISKKKKRGGFNGVIY